MRRLTAQEDEDAKGDRCQEGTVQCAPFRAAAAVWARRQRVQQEGVLERHLLQAVIDAAGPEVALQVALWQLGTGERATPRTAPAGVASRIASTSRQDGGCYAPPHLEKKQVAACRHRPDLGHQLGWLQVMQIT